MERTESHAAGSYAAENNAEETSKAELNSAEKNKSLNVEAVTDVVRQGRLRWFGNVEHKGSND